MEERVRTRFATDPRRDPDNGSWGRRFGALREQPFLEGALVMVRSVPDGSGQYTSRT